MTERGTRWATLFDTLKTAQVASEKLAAEGQPLEERMFRLKLEKPVSDQERSKVYDTIRTIEREFHEYVKQKGENISAAQKELNKAAQLGVRTVAPVDILKDVYIKVPSSARASEGLETWVIRMAAPREILLFFEKKLGEQGWIISTGSIKFEESTYISAGTRGAAYSLGPLVNTSGCKSESKNGCVVSGGSRRTRKNKKKGKRTFVK